MQNKCAVLVNSCDSYKDTWYPFFAILKNRWKDLKYPIYLNTESESYKDNDLNITCINYAKKCAWGKRVKNALNQIDSKYVLFMLDDFFLLDDVKTNKIEECMKKMDEDKNIACFSFNPKKEDEIDIDDGLLKDFLRRPDVCKYKLNCQIGLWRREYLLSYIRDHESPWDFETLGSKRAERYKEKFYILKPDVDPIFDYDFQKYGVIRGKWSKDTPKLLKQYNIDIDYEIRGFYKETPKKKELSFIEKLKPSYFFPTLKYAIDRKIKEYLSLKK